MRIVTWNINSIRIRLDVLKNLIEDYSPDIICFQEIKTEDQFFPSSFFTELGFKYQSIKGQKSYNGVAVISRIPFETSGSLMFVNDQSRHLSIRFRDVELHNFYFPAGGDIADPTINQKFEAKLKYIEETALWFKKYRSQDDKIILVGDLNVAPSKYDVWSHKHLVDVVSHTYMERYAMTQLISSVSLIDAVRRFVPETEKLYSWWSYRNPNWQENDKGRRLDHIFVTRPISDALESYKIIKDTRKLSSTSDHVPVMVDINI